MANNSQMVGELDVKTSKHIPNLDMEVLCCALVDVYYCQLESSGEFTFWSRSPILIAKNKISNKCYFQLTSIEPPDILINEEINKSMVYDTNDPSFHQLILCSEIAYGFAFLDESDGITFIEQFKSCLQSIRKKPKSSSGKSTKKSKTVTGISKAELLKSLAECGFSEAMLNNEIERSILVETLVSLGNNDLASAITMMFESELIEHQKITKGISIEPMNAGMAYKGTSPPIIPIGNMAHNSLNAASPSGHIVTNTTEDVASYGNMAHFTPGVTSPGNSTQVMHQNVASPNTTQGVPSKKPESSVSSLHEQIKAGGFKLKSVNKEIKENNVSKIKQFCYGNPLVDALSKSLVERRPKIGGNESDEDSEDESVWSE